MGLSEFHPITVKPLTGRGSQKHIFKITNFLPEEHSIQTRDISQEIGNGIMTNTNKLLGGSVGGGKWRWPSLATLINYFFQRVLPQQHYHLDLARVGSFLSTFFSLSYIVLVYSCCNYLYVWANDIFKFPFLDISRVPHALTSISGYWAPEVYPCVSRLTTDTTKPIGSSWVFSVVHLS